VGQLKHVPMRTCIACRQKRPKRELIRVVRTPEGCIEFDPRGKRSGRGAYLCADGRCLAGALVPDKLGRALKCRVTAQDVEVIRADIASIAETGRSGESDAVR
jgi:predicted RNA-binding protein YlxR (DUF448 family)